MGILTLREAKTKSEIPLASIPLLFAVQQAIEGALWLSFGSPLLVKTLAYAYSLFSHILWPVFIPFSVYLIEPRGERKKILKALVFIGALIALYDFVYISQYPVNVEVVNQSIAYLYAHFYPQLTLALYVIAVSASGLLSSYPIMKFLGVMAALSLIAALQFYQATFISVWCFFAAVLSIVVYWHFRTLRRPQ